MQFENWFSKLTTPVIICEPNSLRILFMNREAKSCLFVGYNRKTEMLGDVLRFCAQADYDYLLQALELSGFVHNFSAEVLVDTTDTQITVEINADTLTDTDKEYVLISLFALNQNNIHPKIQDLEYKILNIAHHSQDVSASIQAIISLVGQSIHVSRVYIFEDMPGDFCKNTYEWCADGVIPAIDDLQYLPHESFSFFDFANKTGMVIANDIRTMSAADREILEPQGIKSMIILPFFNRDKVLGFVGFDECENYRQWRTDELELLDNVTAILASLIIRQQAEQAADTSYQIMKRVLDNVDAMVYVSDMETHELLFANKALERDFGLKGELTGKICWKTLQRDQTGPCAFCPNPHLLDEQGIPVEPIRKEFQNTITKKWFVITDCAVKWVNGKYVHLESAVEITDRKQNELTLEKDASTDPLTGVYNRGWGYKLADQALKQSREEKLPFSVVFIDVDGLKQINDLHGHSEGDFAILSVVEQIRGNIRKSDIFIRWGGDEFILILPACPTGKAAVIMQGIEKELTAFNQKVQKPFLVNISYGIEEVPCDATSDINSIIECVDAKMYENKQQKKQTGH